MKNFLKRFSAMQWCDERNGLSNLISWTDITLTFGSIWFPSSQESEGEGGEVIVQEECWCVSSAPACPCDVTDWHGTGLAGVLVLHQDMLAVHRSGTGKPSLLPSSSTQSAAAWPPPGFSWWSPPPPWPGQRSPLSKSGLCWVPSAFTALLFSRLKDDGDGLTGPQPSVIGSVDKVFKQVNNFDQYQCLQVLYSWFFLQTELNFLSFSENDLRVHGVRWGRCCQYSFQ